MRGSPADSYDGAMSRKFTIAAVLAGASVAGPLHNWTLGLDDGNAKAPDVGCATKVTVRVDDGLVFLDALELATLAIDLQPPRAGPFREIHQIA